MGKIEFSTKGLVMHEGKFLAVHKSGAASPTFELPGGRMEFGETAEETIVREMAEETGLKVTPIKLLDTWNYVAENWQVTGIIYLCAAENPQNVALSAEHDFFEWLAPSVESFEKMNRLFKPQMLRWNWNELTKALQ